MVQVRILAAEQQVVIAMDQGLHGWPVIDAHVGMTRSGYWARQSHAHGTFDRSMSSTAGDFRLLTPLVLMAALRRAGTQVLQPGHAVRLEAPADTLSALLPALSRLRGVPLSTGVRGAWAVVDGEVPAARIDELRRMLPGLARVRACWRACSTDTRRWRGRPRTGRGPTTTPWTRTTTCAGSPPVPAHRRGHDRVGLRSRSTAQTVPDARSVVRVGAEDTGARGSRAERATSAPTGEPDPVRTGVGSRSSSWRRARARTTSGGTVGFTAELFDRYEPLFEQFWAHPYLRGLHAGTAPAASVLFYVSQDGPYLDAFIRCYGTAISRSPDREWATWFAGQVQFIAEAELAGPHRMLCDAVGVEHAAVPRGPLAPTARAYVDHITRCAQLSLGVGLAALLPCAWTYGWAGHRAMTMDPLPADNPFAPWWEFYGAPRCQEVGMQFRDRTDRLAAAAGAAERESMRDAFELGLRYEIRFWEMAATGEAWGSDDPLPGQVAALADEAPRR